MKEVLSKEHYCYKIHTLVMKNSAYPRFINNPLYVILPNIYKKILIPLL